MCYGASTLVNEKHSLDTPIISIKKKERSEIYTSALLKNDLCRCPERHVHVVDELLHMLIEW